MRSESKSAFKTRLLSKSHTVSHFFATEKESIVMDNMVVISWKERSLKTMEYEAVSLYLELWKVKQRAEELKKEFAGKIAEVHELKNESEKEQARRIDVVLGYMIEEATNVMKKKELADRAEFEKELARKAEKKSVAAMGKELEDREVEVSKLMKERDEELAGRKADKKRVAELEEELEDSNAKAFELERTRSVISGRLLEIRKEKLVLEKELADMNVEKKHVAALKKELADRNAEVSELRKDLDVVLDGMIEEATKAAEEKEMADRAAMEKELALNAEKKLAVELKKELADRNAEVAKLMTENEKALADKNVEKKRVAELEKQLADMDAEVWKLVEKCEEELAERTADMSLADLIGSMYYTHEICES